MPNGQKSDSSGMSMIHNGKIYYQGKNFGDY